MLKSIKNRLRAFEIYVVHLSLVNNPPETAQLMQLPPFCLKINFIGL